MLNTGWAIGEVDYFITRCQQHTRDYDSAGDAAIHNPRIQAVYDDVIGRMPIIEQIADRAWPQWRDHLPLQTYAIWEYEHLLQIAKQVLVMLIRKDELERNLGETGRCFQRPPCIQMYGTLPRAFGETDITEKLYALRPVALTRRFKLRSVGETFPTLRL